MPVRGLLVKVVLPSCLVFQGLLKSGEYVYLEAKCSFGFQFQVCLTLQDSAVLGHPTLVFLLKHDTLGAGNCFSIQIFHDKSWASYSGPLGDCFKDFPCLSGQHSDAYFGGTLFRE